MQNNKGRIPTLLILVAVALLVVFLISLAVFLDAKKNAGPGITLPEAGAHLPENGDRTENFSLVELTPENVGKVVRNMSRPEAYHQTLIKTVGGKARHTTEIWYCGGVWKIISTENGQTRYILTDGKTAYLWYRGETWRQEKIPLTQGMTADDLSGIPTYESIAQLSPRDIQEAGYQTLSDMEDAPCLYLSFQNASGVLQTWWVDLSTGLLCRGSGVLNDEPAYALQQTGLDILPVNDAALLSQLRLPDGSAPFATGSAEMRQE